MGSAMKTDWQQLYSSLELVAPTYGLPFPKPTEDSLDEFESSAHFRLPRSYREFIKVFGPGMFGGYIGIRGPGCLLDIQGAGGSARNFRADLGGIPKTSARVAHPNMVFMSCCRNAEIWRFWLRISPRLFGTYVSVLAGVDWWTQIVPTNSRRERSSRIVPGIEKQANGFGVRDHLMRPGGEPTDEADRGRPAGFARHEGR